MIWPVVRRPATAGPVVAVASSIAAVVDAL